MVNGRLCKKVSLVFFFASLRHSAFLNCETETFERVRQSLKKCECKMVRI